jgi:hypothetical protein
MNLVGDEIDLVEKFFEKLNEYFDDLKEQVKNIESIDKNKKIEETRKTEKNLILCEKILTKKIPKSIELIKEEELKNKFLSKLSKLTEYFHLLQHQIVIVSEFESDQDNLLKLTNDLKLLKIETEIKMESEDENNKDTIEIFLETLKLIDDSLSQYEKLNEEGK